MPDKVAAFFWRRARRSDDDPEVVRLAFELLEKPDDHAALDVRFGRIPESALVALQLQTSAHREGPVIR